MELLGFEEKSTFDFFSFILEYKARQRPRGRVNCQTRARAPRARDAWRKFMEIYGNPRGGPARVSCIDFLPVIGTVRTTPGVDTTHWILLYLWEYKILEI